ncbi:MAG: hypothetical protein K5908_09040 [Erysipelotrichaceae bacterium]|nr:hypothetical protein [Erysipelotrichaceae bacterium]
MDLNKEKKRRIKWITGIAVLALFFLVLSLMPSIRFTDGEHILEKGQSYSAEDFIVMVNGEPEIKDTALDTEKVGHYEFHFKVRKWFLSKDAVFVYDVVDTTPPDLKVLSEEIRIDQDAVYTETDVLSNISVDEGEIGFETDLDAVFPGIYHVDVHAEDDVGNRSFVSYKVIVKDKEAPVIFATGDGAQIARGDVFDIQEIIAYGDNADPDPVLKVEGKVNTNRNGDYPLHVTLRDASGNETEWDLTVSVVSRPEYEDEYDHEEVYPFAEFIEDYRAEGRSFGIDVSEWQGEIDFEKILDEGCEFIMMRIGFSRNGQLILDKSFRDNLAGAKSVGMPVGIYWYSHDKNEEEVRSIMRQIVSELGDTELELPIVFDWENFSYFQEYRISFRDLDHLYDVFVEEAEKMGYQPALYGSKYYLENIWKHTDERKIWLAHYTDWSSYEGPYQIWQTCAWGRIEGVEENVDLDILFRE